MPLHVIDANEGLPQSVRKPFGERQPHEQRPQQPRTGCDGNSIQVMGIDGGSLQGVLDNLYNELLVGTRGKFGHHPAVFRVNELGGDDIGEYAPIREYRGGRFITRGFDSENPHRMMVLNEGLIFKKRLRRSPGFVIFICFFSLPGDVMARMCDVCGKKPVSGNNISHAHNLTRRRWMPNLQNVRVLVNGRTKRMTVCTQCLKSNRVLKAA